MWPRAWRGTVGILAGMLTLYGGGFLFAQYGAARELAGYLLAVNVLGILQQIAISPLYGALPAMRSEEHTSELQSLMRISYAVFCLKKKTQYSKRRVKDEK